MTSFFIYRLPRAKSFIGRSGPVKSGIHTGFLISSFYNHSSALLTIEADKDFSLEDLRKWQKDNASGKEDEGTESVQRLYPLPVRSTSKEDHLENVAAMVSYLCQGEKAICCAAICGNRPIHLADSLISLGTSFPDAMVFCFFTPQSGLWIGASPELLLQKSDDSLFTMALAGTRLADTQKAWDEKNIEEQKMVANYIAS
ncbi:MAG: chorismate-binding protein, partial [Muribaculaceae bacterium]|nr:chorismate-binding protein [Muribaculaceae bacterium]